MPRRLERVGICSTSALAPLQAPRLCETAFGAVFGVNGCRFQCCSSVQSLFLRSFSSRAPSQHRAVTPDHLALSHHVHRRIMCHSDPDSAHFPMCMRGWVTCILAEESATPTQTKPNHTWPGPGPPSQAQLKKALPSQKSSFSFSSLRFLSSWAAPRCPHCLHDTMMVDGGSATGGLADGWGNRGFGGMFPV